MTETCDCSLCRLEKEIAALREENGRLRKQALDWRKWPGNRPPSVKCLVRDDLGFVCTGRYWVAPSAQNRSHWSIDGGNCCIKIGNIVAFAEIPKPEDR